MLTGCGVRRLEDVMGPSSLAQPPGGTSPVPIPDSIPAARPAIAEAPSLNPPPIEAPIASQSTALTAPPANINTPSISDSTGDPEEPDVQPPKPAERLSPLLLAQENRTLFKANHWVAFQTENGIDATDAAGTVCSGRLNGRSDHLVDGQKISLSCSDGKTATLAIRQSKLSNSASVMIVDGDTETVTIAKAAFPPE